MSIYGCLCSLHHVSLKKRPRDPPHRGSFAPRQISPGDDDKNDDNSGVVDRDERKKRRLRTSKSCETVVKRIKRAK